MDELSLASCMAVMLIIALTCMLVFKKLKMPAIVGYIAAGIIIKNYYGNYDDVDLNTIVSLLSDIGLTLLMFTIGMELNFKKLRKYGTLALVVVLCQVPMALCFGALLGKLFNWDFVLSMAVGAMFAGSSTAVVLAVQKEKKVLEGEAMDIILMILVIEDVAQVLLLSILTPMMETSVLATSEIILLIVKIMIFMVVSVIVGLLFVPKLINIIGDKTNTETLLVAALAMCFLLSALAEAAGISMAVGSFLMGVIVTKSNYVHKIESGFENMKDIFLGMFFISVGLMVNPRDIIDNIPMMLAILAAFMAANLISVNAGFFLGNSDPKQGFLSACAILTIGEFAFIISTKAHEIGIMSNGIHAAIIGAALISMVLVSFISAGSPRIYDSMVNRRPRFVQSLANIMFTMRDEGYKNMKSLSTGAFSRFKHMMVDEYVSFIAVVGLLAIFYLYTGNITAWAENILDDHTTMIPAWIVRVAEFLILIVPLSILVSCLKSLSHYLFKNKDIDFSKEPTFERYLKDSMDISLWIPTMFYGFLLMLLVPSKIDLVEQFLMTLLGMGIFAIIWFYAVNKIEKTHETEEESQLSPPEI